MGGDSAGGNLAAVMALSARDGTVPPLCYQVLIYPATDFAMNTQAYARFTSGLPLTAGSTRWFADQYVADADRGDWRASPARAQTLAGTPPAFVLTAGYDPLCDEGQDYARRLERDGVRVCAVYMADQMHGFLTMGGTIRAAETLACMVGAVLRDAFSRD